MTLLDKFGQIIVGGLGTSINAIQSSADIEGYCETTCILSRIEIRVLEFTSDMPSGIRITISAHSSSDIIGSCEVIGKPIIRHRSRALILNGTVFDCKTHFGIEYALAKMEDELCLMMD